MYNRSKNLSAMGQVRLSPPSPWGMEMNHSIFAGIYTTIGGFVIWNVHIPCFDHSKYSE